MKRADALAPLSRDHHAALVLAKRIATAQRDSAAAGALASRALDTFARELEPHFRIEEASLLPRLQAAGQSALVARTLSEHEELRELERRIRAGDVESLWRFGSLLDAHVRFEERELFPVSESVLGTESLAAVALAAQRPPTRAEPSLPPGSPQHPESATSIHSHHPQGDSRMPNTSHPLHLSADAIYPFDARGVAKRFRHAAIFGALDALQAGETMRFVNDHDPIPLLAQLKQRYGESVDIRYQQREPGAIVIDFVRR